MGAHRKAKLRAALVSCSIFSAVFYDGSVPVPPGSPKTGWSAPANFPPKTRRSVLMFVARSSGVARHAGTRAHGHQKRGGDNGARDIGSRMILDGWLFAEPISDVGTGTRIRPSGAAMSRQLPPVTSL